MKDAQLKFNLDENADGSIVADVKNTEYEFTYKGIITDHLYKVPKMTLIKVAWWFGIGLTTICTVTGCPFIGALFIGFGAAAPLFFIGFLVESDSNANDIRDIHNSSGYLKTVPKESQSNNIDVKLYKDLITIKETNSEKLCAVYSFDYSQLATVEAVYSEKDDLYIRLEGTGCKDGKAIDKVVVYLGKRKQDEAMSIFLPLSEALKKCAEDNPLHDAYIDSNSISIEDTQLKKVKSV